MPEMSGPPQRQEGEGRMNYEQLAVAMKAIGELSIKLRAPGDWYVNHRGVERREVGCLSSGCVSGKTPEDAIAQHWVWLTDPKFYLLISPGGNREAVRWNGFMWERVDEERAA